MKRNEAPDFLTFFNPVVIEKNKCIYEKEIGTVIQNRLSGGKSKKGVYSFMNKTLERYTQNIHRNIRPPDFDPKMGLSCLSSLKRV